MDVWFRWTAGKTNIKVEIVLEDDGRRWYGNPTPALVNQNTISPANFGSESWGILAATERKLSDSTTGTGWYFITWPATLSTPGRYRLQLYEGTPTPDGSIAAILIAFDGTKIVDDHNVGFTTTHVNQLNAIHSKLPSKAFIAGTANSDGDIEIDQATGNYPGTVAAVTAVGTVTGHVQGNVQGNVNGSVNAVTNPVAANIIAINSDWDAWSNLVLAVDAIGVVSEQHGTMLEIIGSGPDYRYKATALDQGPTGVGILRYDPKVTASYDDQNKTLRLLGWMHFNGELYELSKQAIFNVYREGSAAPIASITNTVAGNRFFSEIPNLLLNPDNVYHFTVTIRDNEDIDHIGGIGVATLD